MSRTPEHRLGAGWIVTGERHRRVNRPAHPTLDVLLSHTHRSLDDTIGPSSVTATGITLGPAILVTTQYGRVALWVHPVHRPVAALLDPNPGGLDHRGPTRIGPLATMGHAAPDFTRPPE